jgi:hypothetical protein
MTMNKFIKNELALYTNEELFGRWVSALDEMDREVVQAEGYRVFDRLFEQALDMSGDGETVDFDSLDGVVPYLLF